MAAEQWDHWQKPAQVVVASTTPSPSKPNPVEPVLAKPVAQAPESVVFPSKPDVASPVNMATLESMLQGFERRLTQRLSLPVLNTEAPEAQAITFVSTDDLQTAMQGLEARLIAQLETGARPASVLPEGSPRRKPPLNVGMQSAIATFFAADSFVYVFVVQNVILLLLAAGMAWRWFRKRAE